MRSLVVGRQSLADLDLPTLLLGSLSFTLMNHFVWKLLVACLLRGGTPLPLPIGIIELQAKRPKISEFKGLIVKIFRNKDLGCQRALKIGLGQLRGPSWETGTLLAAPIRSPLSRMAGGMSVMALTDDL